MVYYSNVSTCFDLFSNIYFFSGKYSLNLMSNHYNN